MMKRIEITTIGEAKKYMSGLSILWVMLALNQGHTVIDEYSDIELVFSSERSTP